MRGWRREGQKRSKLGAVWELVGTFVKMITMNANAIGMPGNTTMTAETMGVVGQTLADMLMAGILGEDSVESEALD